MLGAPGPKLSLRLMVLALAAGLAAPAAQSCGQTGDAEAAPGQPSPLPLPSSMSVREYEARLFDFLNRRQYRELGWAVDKGVRDTGPFLHGKSYGTHPAVRIYYSPEIIQWLGDGKQRAIPDGAMMIKEQFKEPAARYNGLDDEKLWARLTSWSVMVKDAAGSHDGWFWSNPAKGQQPVDCFKYPFEEAVSGFGLYCVRCHASTKTTGETNEYTFASLRNVKGFPGEPMRFNVDDSWLKDTDEEEPDESVPAPEDVNEPQLAKRAAAREGATKGGQAQIAPRTAQIEPVPGGAAAVETNHPRCTDAANPTMCPPLLNKQFLAVFASIGAARALGGRAFAAGDARLVGEAAREHAGQAGVRDVEPVHELPRGTLGAVRAGDVSPGGRGERLWGRDGRHLSPYGEWRWTPMGLAGRDPIFYAQLESEAALIRREAAGDAARGEKLAATLADACLKCHGVMGSRQFHLDHGESGSLFGVEHVLRESTAAGAAGEKDWRYGALCATA